MTHYTIDYSNDTPQDKYKKAIGDVIDYMGTEHFSRIAYMFKQYSEMPREQFALQMSLAGVRGYPIEALHDYFWPYG